MPIPIQTIRTDFPGPIFCPFTGARADGPCGPNLHVAWFVECGNVGLFETNDGRLRSLMDDLLEEDLGIDELATRLDVEGAFILRIDRGWNGVDTYGFRPPPQRMWGLSPEILAARALELETIVEDLSGAFCPVCGKIVMDLAAQKLRLCPHVISAVLDLAPEVAEVHPAWAEDPHGEPDRSKLDPGRDALLQADEWVPISVRQFDHRNRVTGSWTVRVAWPIAEMDQDDPCGSVIARVEALEAHFASAIGGDSLNPENPGPDWTPDAKRGMGLSVTNPAC